jgi:hypothetical protein
MALGWLLTAVVKRWVEVIWDSTPSSRIFADEDASASGSLEPINPLD